MSWVLRVGGRVVRTTAEHPFFRDADGWVAANGLRVGDRLRCEDGSRVAVEGVRDTGTWDRVYNLRVADYHTYFVGCDEWGFGVWAHNADYGSAPLNKVQKTAIAKEWIAAKNAGAADPVGYSGASYAQKMKIRAIATQLIEADPTLLKPGASQHGNFATQTPGVRYNLARLSDDPVRQAAGFADHQMGSVKKIGETTLAHQLPDGTWVQRRYTKAELKQWGVDFQVVDAGPQTQMRANQSAALRAYEQQHGHLPELNANFR